MKVAASVLEAPLVECIERAVESQTFERAPTLRVLLIYLWRNRDQPISEYAIATEALGRSPAFDAKTDATVRVQISRLRQRLEKFYEQEGANCRERLAIPVGTHQIRVETIDVPTLAPVESLPWRRRYRWNRWLVALSLALVLLSTVLAIGLYRARAAARAGAADPIPRFWTAFMGNRPALVVLPTPIFFTYTDGLPSAIMLRDTSVNEFAEWPRDPVLTDFSKKFGRPNLAQSYTVTSDTFASVRLVRYLDRLSYSPQFHSSSEAPMEALDSDNVIAVGTWGTLAPFRNYLERMSFQLGPHELWVDIRQPRPGEPPRIDEVVESQERTIYPGVIAVLPGHGRKTRLLILASRHTSALVTMLTTVNGLEQLDRLWRARGKPEFYEVIVNSEMNGSNMVRSWPVFLRPFPTAAGVTAGN
jgi:hypothetical protein